MACPNLEALTGFYCFYNHTFDRLTHALSTRKHLRQHAWIVAENDDVTARGQTQLPPGLLDEDQSYQFVLYHDRWKRLETLLLCSPGGLGVIEHELFIRVLHSLPALKNLCISSFDTDDFHDLTLLSLPPWVTTLRLEECLGVTDTGLTRWAASPNAAQMERLSLLHQNITSLLTISKIFASLDRLIKFTIVQSDAVPSLPKEMRQLVVQPVLASKSLQFLHWDISRPKAGPTADPDDSEPERGQTTPNMHLALSVSHGGFPRLRRLRAPRDTSPLGILQSVCQPLYGHITLPGDASHSHHYRQLRRSGSLCAARLRARKIEVHQSNSTRTPASKAGNQLQAPSTDRGTLRPPAQNATSDSSTSTLGSWRTVGSNTSKRSSITNQTGPGPGPGPGPVSPLTASQDHFSPLAPDDGIISPIAADQDQVYLAGGDSDKQAVTGPQRSNHGESRKRHSICRCTPNPTGNRDSISAREGHEGSRQEKGAGVVPLPSRSPFRPIQTYAHSSTLTRFPSLTIRTPQRNRPVLYLRPDVPGLDSNGGLIGWGELLRISEKARKSTGSQRAREATQRNSKSSLDENSDDDDDDDDKAPTDMCTGFSTWHSRSEDGLGDLPMLRKIMSGSSAASGASSGRQGRSRSKSTSSSRLSFSLGVKTSDKDTMSNRRACRHVARPRGDRGGCVGLDDFF
ncbi:hypothetical protein CLCR_02316 [Cladophialophora carrionii]|uniref:Uncharacterized protein n=1 Tax=Cladophialophora carrionii TaxID=86049 RepID=A0A1C1CF26_9EURO|nr:hypothetical protein CLCR_02316 [Cladophialophora carrionii]